MPHTLPAFLQQYTGSRHEPSANSTFGCPMSVSPSSHGRSASEVRLANLHLDYISSKLDDLDLLDSLPRLPKSVAEVESESERMRFADALAHVASTDSPIRVKSPTASSRRSSSYFNLSRNLFHDADSSYTSSSGGSSFSTPSLESDSDFYTASSSCSPLPTPLEERCEFTGDVAPSSLDSVQVVAAQPPPPPATGIAARRRTGMPPMRLVNLPPFKFDPATCGAVPEPKPVPTSFSWSDSASPQKARSRNNSLSSESTRAQWRQDFADIAGIERPGSPRMLRVKKRSTGFAF
ncbi:hypothetical protein JCM10212_005358 [Sporobolomyces blumeae]